MTGLTDTDPDATADLTLPTTAVEAEEHETEDPGMAGPVAATGRADPAAPAHPPPQDSTVNAPNSHSGVDASTVVNAARPVVLVRYRPGVTGYTARIVHVAPLPTDGQAGTVSALCGTRLSRAAIETVTPDQGMPCQLCVLNHITNTPATGKPPAANPDAADTAELATDEVTFQNWGWPVTRHRDQIRLNLHHDVSALTIPIPLCTTVTEILTHRRCTPRCWPTPTPPTTRSCSPDSDTE